MAGVHSEALDTMGGDCLLVQRRPHSHILAGGQCRDLRVIEPAVEDAHFVESLGAGRRGLGMTRDRRDAEADLVYVQRQVEGAI